jgi:hypothetical protein
MSGRQNDDVEYSEYYIRKTIQPYSLRTPTRAGNTSNIFLKKNLSLYLNKQTAHFRSTMRPDAPVKEMFKREDPKALPIFPFVQPTPKLSKSLTSDGLRKLLTPDKNGWIFKKVEEYLED